MRASGGTGPPADGLGWRKDDAMGPMYFVMAILGCADGSEDCREARLVPVRYTTMAQCRAALPEQLARNTDVPFPVIGADCRRAGAEIAAAGKAKPRG